MALHHHHTLDAALSGARKKVDVNDFQRVNVPPEHLDEFVKRPSSSLSGIIKSISISHVDDGDDDDDDDVVGKNN